MPLLGGRYRLVEPVGQGGMAVVWRADDELLHRTVAVKLLAPQLASDRRSRELIRAEAYAAAQLNHPHIANVYDYGEARQRGFRRVPYLVMEFVRGDTLAARLRAGGALDWPEAVRVCADVAAALAAAHAEGLVHRDVKPDNVLLSPTGVKLVDLGIALAVGQRSVGEQGEVLGTPRYMAPEQVNGDPAVPASDVYALGLLLHECLTGAPLHRGATVAELVARDHLAHAASEPDVPGLPEPVSRLRRRCLAPEPVDRPTSAEVAALLAETVGRRPATIVGPAVPRAAAPEQVLTTRLAAPASRSTQPVRVPAIGPAAGDGPPRRSVRRGLLLAAAPATALTALTAVLAAQLPGLTSANDAAEGAGTGVASPAAGCTARYTADRAPDATFRADLTVTSTGPQAPQAWILSFALPAGQRLTGSSGDVRLRQRAGTVTVDVGRAAPAGTATIGLRGTYDTTAAGGEPTGFALNGLPCGRASTSITSTTTGSLPADDQGGVNGPGGVSGGGSGGTAPGADGRDADGPYAGDPSRPVDVPSAPTAGPASSQSAATAAPQRSRTAGEPSPTGTTAPPDTPGPVESTETGGEPAPTSSTGDAPAAEPSATP
ncbi:protein kinase domain-containing protein [Micromonospora sp. DT47]|uniref:serine/threonine-protein kinase n=1 Tax=Micromonospora sp. DT47 TaxID=3393431 RepID=UPI003CE81360